MAKVVVLDCKKKMGEGDGEIVKVKIEGNKRLSSYHDFIKFWLINSKTNTTYTI